MDKRIFLRIVGFVHDRCKLKKNVSVFFALYGKINVYERDEYTSFFIKQLNAIFFIEN